MSKEKKLVYDTAQYNYHKDTLVQINGRLLLSILMMMENIVQKETKFYHIITDDENNFEEVVKNGKAYISPEGLSAHRVSAVLRQIHQENIENKVAVHINQIKDE